MKNYITDTDDTLKRTSLILAFIWFVTISIAVGLLIQPNKPNTLLKPIVYEVNGIMPGSNYAHSEIKP